MIDLLGNMNPQQREAILAAEGPLLVMAGAGSGKTRVLTHRIAYLMQEKMVAPWNILAITFTNKAAREMRERVFSLIGDRAADVWISTFHAMCVRILRRDSQLIGYDKSFGILDDADQLSVIKEVMKELNLDPKRNSPKSFLAQISNAKNQLKTGSDLKKDHAHPDLVRVYEKYQEKLFKNNRMDFDDLLMLTVHLFDRHPEVLSFYQHKFQYIHIDEYQDTNHAQYRLVQLMAANYRNICVVGDSDQSIYSWRGADIQNILSFEKDYPEANVILLEQNYRSKQTILNAANDVIANNGGRREKKLWSDRGDGTRIQYYRATDGDFEARYIAERITDLRPDAADYGDFAVLYRTNSQSRGIEQALLRANIPYRLVGGLSYFKRKEIKDLMAYLRLIANPGDDISFARVINEPKRGIGAATLEKLHLLSLTSQTSLMEAVSHAPSVLTKAPAGKLAAFKNLISGLRQEAGQYSVTDFIDVVLETTGYLEMLENEDTIEAHSRIDNLMEFKNMAKQFEDRDLPEKLKEEGFEEDPATLTTLSRLVILLNDLMLQTDTETPEESKEPKVTLMTIHAAKGLEYPTVFVTGFEDGIFPLHSAIEQGREELEEERRLAYVAITRAKDSLYLTNAQRRYQHGQGVSNMESRFLREIADEYLERTGMAVKRVPFASGRPTFSLQDAVEKPKPKVVSTLNLNENADWSIGDKLTHESFGDGVVVGAKSDILTIAFGAQHGIKKLLGSHPALKKR